MVVVGWILTIIGLFVALLGWWNALREMFAESRGLGYMAFSVPFVAWIYSLIHFEDLKREFWFMSVGVGLLAAGTSIRVYFE